MASISKDQASGLYRIHFRFRGKQYQKSLRTASAKEADSKRGQIETTLKAIREGWLTPPAGGDFWEFVFSGGKVSAVPAEPEKTKTTLGGLLEAYLASLPEGTMEQNSLDTRTLHFSHLKRILGEKRVVDEVTTAELQKYIAARAKEFYRGRKIQGATIRKEVCALHTAWNWGNMNGLVGGALPGKKLNYPKGSAEADAFMTWAEIEARVQRNGLTDHEKATLWECLFMDTSQIQAFLDHVKATARFPFIYPMCVFVAHTGARRSEMRRALVHDVDLPNGTIVLREKKKDRSKQITLRRVPMSNLLKQVMTEWLAVHPGGDFLFCQTTTRMKKRDVPEPLSRKMSDHHFRMPLKNSKWRIVSGFHVLRHSFASNLAAAGIDARVIDNFLGHQTEAMRRRYMHLYPKNLQAAIEKVFD